MSPGPALLLIGHGSRSVAGVDDEGTEAVQFGYEPA